MNKSSIANNILQELLDSAANAADKGQAQWFTPPDWAKVLSIPLCQYRPNIVDLACRNGALLAGGRKRGTRLLGCDIDGSAFSLQPCFPPSRKATVPRWPTPSPNTTDAPRAIALIQRWRPCAWRWIA